MFKKVIFISSLQIINALSGSMPQLGPNNLQPAPIVSSATKADGIITVTGRLVTLKRNATFIIQFFSNSINRNPITEGDFYLGEITIVTDCNGIASFNAILPPTQNNFPFLSATATYILEDSSLADTSPYSLNIPIV